MLDSWIIDEELVTPFDLELIVFNIANLDEKAGSMKTSQEVTGWCIKAMSEEETQGPSRPGKNVQQGWRH